jgi:hypothetical protein
MRVATVIVAAGIALSGCATITRGTSERFRIESNPVGANITLSTGQTCITPCHLHLKRKHDFTATAAKPGYETQTANITTNVRIGGLAAVSGNVLIGGIIGAVIDGSNGAMKDLSPNPLVFTLRPDFAAVAAESVASIAAVASTPEPNRTTTLDSAEGATDPTSAGAMYDRVCRRKGKERPLFCSPPQVPLKGPRRPAGG